MKQTIAIFTSNRSEWGILEPLALELKKKYNLHLIVCASHLSTSYGTFRDIPLCFDVSRIENTLDSNTQEGACKSAGILFMNLPDVLKRAAPRFVIILGDRYESHAAATVCYTMGIKIVHIHGGEKSGNIDDGFRDCISRLSYVHFVATNKAQERLKRILPDRKRIYYVGALSCKDLPKAKKDRKYITVMYHPVTDCEENFEEVLQGLGDFFDCRSDDKVCFIAPNVDFGRKDIEKKIQNFADDSCVEIKIVRHLERQEFLKLLANSKCLIGNSSAGIIEAPTIGIPTVNIGSRQNNREKAASVCDVSCIREDIFRALAVLENKNFDIGDNFFRPYVYFKTEKLIRGFLNYHIGG
jgi:UDP-hydrolysing UDP-N-acetyl-D-glucosamine 2-epimerase